jgi:hypothetical protein
MGKFTILRDLARFTWGRFAAITSRCAARRSGAE